MLGTMSTIDEVLAGHWIATLEFDGGPLNGTRMLAPAVTRSLFFEGFDESGTRPILTADASQRQIGRYDAAEAYDCAETCEAVLVMRWRATPRMVRV